MSPATRDDLPGPCLGYSQNVLQFQEMIELCLLFGR